MKYLFQKKALEYFEFKISLSPLIPLLTLM